MKLSCIPICFFDAMIREKTMFFEDWVKIAVELKLDGIELYQNYIEDWEATTLHTMADFLRVKRLRVSMFTGYNDFAHPDPLERGRQMEQVQRNVDVARLFRTDIVRVVAGRWPEAIESLTLPSRDEALRNVITCFSKVVGYAKSSRIKLAFENHPEIGTRTEDFMAILEGLGRRKKLMVNLDTSNSLLAGDRAEELAERVCDRVVHVHVSDRDVNLDHVPIGQGIVNFEAIFGVLKRGGYDGWLSLEVGGSGGKEGIRESMDYVKEAWEKA